MDVDYNSQITLARRKGDNALADEYQRNWDYLQGIYGMRNSGDIEGLEKALANRSQYKYAGENAQGVYNDSIGELRRAKSEREAAAKEKRERELSVANAKNAAINSYGDQARRGLTNNILEARRGANARGMLYSSQRAGAEQGLRAQASGAIANQRAAVNKASDEQIGQMTQASAGRNLQDWGTQIQSNQNAYQDALNRYKQKTAGLGAFGQGVGAVGGLLPF